MAGRAALTLILLAGCGWCLTLVARAENALSSQPEAAAESTESVRLLMREQDRHRRLIAELVMDDRDPDGMKRIVFEAERLAEVAGSLVTRVDGSGREELVRDLAIRVMAEVRGSVASGGSVCTRVFSERLDTACQACHDLPR